MRKPTGLLGAITGLVGFSALGGLLVAAMVAPALAVTSVTATSSIGVFENLPDYIELGSQSQRNTIYALRDGQPEKIAQVFHQNREEVSWDNVSQFVKDALVAGEDRRFYEHGGVDLPSLVRAAEGWLSTGEAASGGGSTLSMQLVKNIRVMDAVEQPTEDKVKEAYADAIKTTPARKLKEMKMAIGLEKRYSKDEILLAYLNIAGYGGQIYGIESAAQHYYSVSAKDVTLAQAASLIAIVQQPNLRRPDQEKNYAANKSRRDFILGNMLELGYIDQQQHDEAVATPIEPKLSDVHSGCINASDAKSFCDYVLKNVKNLEALGNTPEERARNWKRGGYSVYTTLDLNQQDNAQAQLAQYTPADEARFALGGAASALEVGTGRIRVMAQNKGFDDSFEGGGPTTTAVNYNTDRPYGGSSGFPVGSTYKIFTLVDWLQNGHGTQEVVNGNMRTFTSFPSKCWPGGVWTGKATARNDGGSNPGSLTVAQATARSVNNAFFTMAEKLDLCEIRDTAKTMGVHRADGADLKHEPSSILGINEIAPLTMAAAIATVASGGLYCEPIAVESIVGPDGTELPGQKPDCRQALTPEIANTTAYVLAGVMNGGTGSSANPRDGHPLIGKTGTTDSAEHTWMLGSSSKNALAVWVGNISGHQSLYRLNIAGIAANTVRHRIFKATIAGLNATYGGDAFPPPADNLIHGITQAVPSVVGQSLSEAQSLLESLGFEASDGGAEPSAQPVGTVTRTDPAAGSRLSRGYNVTVYTSDGSLSVRMPSVVGSQLSQAMKDLERAGFNKGNVTVTYVETIDPQKVCLVQSSDPAGGADTSKDARVTLTVATIKDDQDPKTPAIPQTCGPKS